MAPRPIYQLVPHPRTEGGQFQLWLLGHALGHNIRLTKKRSNGRIIFRLLAEGVGFEPTLRFPVNTLSKRAPSATRPPLLIAALTAASSCIKSCGAHLFQLCQNLPSRPKARISPMFWRE